ncbi:2593_t:CDS:2 [Cetraspora pellucida]|uniref:2593_t:CDS:1 n=1 Tax=Cetraspora pellucida TaxID=1433469 RepID=A0A9N9CVI1_9GLOM|nr:2593_t:CDS:2 [Cetraspora pellucida]
MIEPSNYLQQVETLLKLYNIKEFDSSQCQNRELIARGGFSLVYSTTFQKKSYALKRLYKNDNQALKLLKREIKLLHKVEHPNVIKFYGISREQAPQRDNIIEIMLVLQLANGGNLQDHLAKKQHIGLYKISWTELVQIAMDIASGDISEGLREKEITNTPQKYVDLYNQCWSSDPSQRPTVDIVLSILKKLQTEKAEFISHIISEKWIKHFGLHKGRNFNGNGFVLGTGIILGDNGFLEMEKIRQPIPIIYLPKENEIETEHDNIHIHIPMLTLHYECDPTKKFIQDIKEVLDIKDETEKKTKLDEKLNYYGEYVVTSATIGGVIEIKNWSEFDDARRSRLKTYLQWSIDYAKGIKVNNFEKASIEDLHLFTNSKSMKNAENLYKWVKDLHNPNSLEIISYEKFKPTIQLLPEDLILKCSNREHTDESELISKTRSRYDKINISEWVTSPALPLYTCDWIQDNLLQHGIILQRSKAGRAKKAAFKFLKEPKITPINKITIILSQHKTRQEEYLLENGIILKKEEKIELDKIPSAEHSSTLNIPLEDFTKKQPSNAIYCQVIFQTIKISFDLLDIEYLQEFTNTVDSALQDQNESSRSKTLCKLFGEDYGHLLPRTFTLGGVLSKKYISNNHPLNIQTQRLDLKSDDPNAHSKIEQLLEAWNNEFKDVNTFYFLNNEGDVIYRNKIGDWLKTLADEPKIWCTISWEDWIQLYKTSPSDNISFNGSVSSVSTNE